MRDAGASVSRRYGLAVTFWAAAVVMRVLLDLVFDSNPFFTPFYPAVLLSSWFGGMSAGLLTVILTIPSGAYFWIAGGSGPPPYGWLYVSGAAASMIMIVVVTELLHGERRRAQESEARADRRARQLAEEARARDQFLAMLSHELRNPLSALRSTTKLLRADPSAPGVDGHAAVIERQVEQMARLLDDIFDVVKISRKGIPLRRQPVAIDLCVNGAVESARAEVARKRQHLVVEVPATPLYVNGDRVRLVQAISNLLTNATKYTADGGRIELCVDATNSSVRIHVRDNGRGIAPALLPRVFDLFVQGDASLARSDGGLGVGLYLVQQIAALHEGRASGHSEGEGAGSDFSIELPRIDPPPAPRVESPSLGRAAPPPRGGGPLRVLVVDDHADSAASLALLLDLDGHLTRVAHDATTALAVADEFSPNVVITDIGLPGIDGYELARRLRQRQGVRAQRIIALTGYGDDATRLRSHENGFDEHLVKPVDLDGLRALLGC